MEKCKNYQKNLKNCNCSYDPCDRKGFCCECIAYHRQAKQLPACLFPDDIECSYDRSIGKFVEINQRVERR